MGQFAKNVAQKNIGKPEDHGDLTYFNQEKLWLFLPVVPHKAVAEVSE